MDLIKENIDDLNAIIKIKVSEDDYKARVEKILKDTQKKAQMPGFRKGMVPAGMVKKMYGKSVMADEINKLLYDSLNKYIVDNKLEVLGNPLPKALDENFDWDTQKEFEFAYDLGLAPKIEVNFTNVEPLNYYTVKIDNELLDKYKTDIARRYGKFETPEQAADTDLVYFELQELNTDNSPKEDGIKKNSSLAIDMVKTDLKSKLIGAKKGDKIIATAQSLSDNTTDLASILGVSKEQAETINTPFELSITSINRMTPADLNQELFNKVYGEGIVNSVEEFEAKITEEITTMFANDSDRKLKSDVANYWVNKLKLTLPDAFLKRWIKATNEKPISEEQINAEYDSYARSLKNQLVENKIITDYNIEVKNEEVLAFTKQMLNDQYFKYNPEAIDDTFLTETATKLLQKQEDARRVYEMVYDKKILALYKEKFDLNKVELSYDDFVKKLNDQ